MANNVRQVQLPGGELYNIPGLPQKYLTCSAPTTTYTKVVTSDGESLMNGAIYSILFTNDLKTNTSTNTSITLKVGTNTARSIYWEGQPTTATRFPNQTTIAKGGAIVTVMYDGSQFQIIAINEAISTIIRTWTA